MQQTKQYFDHIKEGNLEELKAFVQELGANIKDDWQNSALYNASFYNQLPIVQYLLDQGASLDPQALIVACSNKYNDIALLLLDKGIDPNQQDRNGLTALMRSAELNPDMFHPLLDKGAQIDMLDRENRSLIFYASRLDILQTLLQKGFNLEEKDSGEQTALNRAASFGQSKKIEALLQAGAEINTVDSRLNTPLINAVIQGSQVVVEMLLAAKPNAENKNKEDRTALSEALLRKDKKIQKLLITISDIDIFDAVRIGQLSLVKKHLKDSGLDVESNGENLLIKAIYWQHLSLVKFFIAEGLDVNSRDARAWPAIKYACFQPNSKTLKILQYLLDQGANPNDVDHQEASCLLYCASYTANNKHSIALVENGADIELADKYGTTPLMAASASGNVKLVEYLIEQGAQLDKVNKRRQGLQDIIEAKIKLNSWDRALLKKYAKIQKLLAK